MLRNKSSKDRSQSGTARRAVPDLLRGFTVISMVIYHAMWDLIYLFGTQSGMAVHRGWYDGLPGFIWQQSICWTFILLSGYCVAFSRNPIKRGLIVTACGLLVSLVTFVFTPEARIVFGVLTFLGVMMIVAGVMRKVRAVSTGTGTDDTLYTMCHCTCPFDTPGVIPGVICAVLFILTRNVNRHALGFGAWEICRVPDALYANLFTAFLGFPPADFVSADYFSLLPWGFLFGVGVCLRRVVDGMTQRSDSLCPKDGHSKTVPSVIQKDGHSRTVPSADKPDDASVHHVSVLSSVLGFIGRHSLIIYMFHQAIIYGILSLLYVVVSI